MRRRRQHIVEDSSDAKGRPGRVVIAALAVTTAADSLLSPLEVPPVWPNYPADCRSQATCNICTPKEDECRDGQGRRRLGTGGASRLHRHTYRFSGAFSNELALGGHGAGPDEGEILAHDSRGGQTLIAISSSALLCTAYCARPAVVPSSAQSKRLPKPCPLRAAQQRKSLQRPLAVRRNTSTPLVLTTE